MLQVIGTLFSSIAEARGPDAVIWFLVSFKVSACGAAFYIGWPMWYAYWAMSIHQSLCSRCKICSRGTLSHIAIRIRFAFICGPSEIAYISTVAEHLPIVKLDCCPYANLGFRVKMIIERKLLTIYGHLVDVQSILRFSSFLPKKTVK